MAIVIHKIGRGFYAYEHHRIGNKVKSDYIGRSGGEAQHYKDVKSYTTCPECNHPMSIKDNSYFCELHGKIMNKDKYDETIRHQKQLYKEKEAKQ